MPVLSIKPKTETEKITRTVVDTIMVTPETVRKWKAPMFQRPLRDTHPKVLMLVEEMRANGGVFPGIVTLGVLNGETYLIDGQHRAHAFLTTCLQEGYTDVRIHHFTSLAQMGTEFVKLNSQLVKLRPDDILRGLEPSMPLLSQIRADCPFIGYDVVRRNQKNSPVLSMSVAIRCWAGSQSDVPSGSGVSSLDSAKALNDLEARNFIEFSRLALRAFGRDQEYARLWGSLNLTLCMWLYRRLVVTQYSAKSVRLTAEMFTKCLMSLTAETDYVDWLLGRQMGERDRGPCYGRIKTIFAHRIMAETGKKVSMPSPAWDTGTGRER